MINASVNMLSQSLLLQTGGNGLFQNWNGFNPFSSLADFASDHPVITFGGGFAAVTASTIAAIRLWRNYQASLPPAGMTDIPPRRMDAFFAERANDGEAVVRLLLGVHTNATPQVLTEARRMIADEISELQETLDALQNHPNAKKREVISNAIAAYRDLAAIASLRAGEKTRAREGLLSNPNEVYKSIVKRLNDLDSYRAILATQYFRKAYGEGVGASVNEKPSTEIASIYKAMGDEVCRVEARRAIRAWQKLAPAQRNFFWSLMRKGSRDPMIAPSFLFVYLKLRNSPDLPNDPKVQESKLGDMIAGEIKRIETSRALPAHIRNMDHAMVILREEIVRGSAISKQLDCRLMTSVRIKTDGDTPKVELEADGRTFEMEPEKILIARKISTDADDEDEDKIGDTQWISPRITEAQARLPESQKPRLIYDLTLLPSPSLGEGHKVIVDMEDRRMKEFLERLRPYRERMEKGESNAVIAGELWKELRASTEKPDRERLAKVAAQGRIHSLFDLIDNTAVAERAILVQIAFQNVGIRSGIEKNDLTVMSNKDQREIALGLQFWIRIWLSGDERADSYILHPMLQKYLKASDPNFERFIDQPSHAGPAPSSGRTSGSASGLKPVDPSSRSTKQPDAVLSPAPVAAPVDEDERPTLIPPRISGSAATVLAPIPPPPPSSVSAASDVSNVGRDEPTMQIHIGELKGLAVRAEFTVWLRDRFRNLNNDDPDTTSFTAAFTKDIFDAWDKAGRPATEFDDRGFPKRIPEDFANEAIENWLLAKEKSPFPKDHADAAALRAADRDRQAGLEFGTARKTPSQPPSVSHVGPPPLPPSADEIKADIRTMMFRRYPSLREDVAARLVGAFVEDIYKKAGDQADKQMETLVSLVRGTLKAMNERPAYRDVIAGILAADGIWEELRERRKAFRETTWSAGLQDALQVIYEAWKKSDRSIETSPKKTPLIPEAIFEAGYADFFSLLQKRYPKVPEEVLRQTFMDSDEGPRAKRWAPPTPPANEADVMEVEDGELIRDEAPASQPPAPSSQKPSDVSNVRARPVSTASADATARLLERYPFLLGYMNVTRALVTNIAKAVDTGAEIGQSLDTEVGNIFLHLANTPRLNPREEAILKGLAEADLVRALKENYAFFRDPKRPRAAQVQAAEIYRLWNANNRTFDGKEKVRPLRIPERFIEQWMDVLIGHLHKTDRALADAIAGSRVDRVMGRRDSVRPPAPPMIPISEETILLELADRVPEFATNKAIGKDVRFLAQTVYKAWLKTDPARNLERSGSGLHGLVPEAILEDKLKRYLAYLRTTKVAVTDRGNRETRGTGVLERQIQKRTAA